MPRDEESAKLPADELASLGVEERRRISLDAALTRARRAWPELHVDAARFHETLARASTPDPEREVPVPFIEDLYLAHACAHGDEAAIAEFERSCVPVIRATLQRMALTPGVVEETTQVMRDELLVGDERDGRALLNYRGSGPLHVWLRSVAARTALRVLRFERPGVEIHESVAAGSDDLELAYLKKRYSGTFAEAFQEAFAALPASDRLLLKQRLRHQVSIVELGAIHGVHPSSISRWVTDARERLVGLTRDAMMRRLNIGRAEVSSLFRLIQSEVDLTLSSVA